MKTLRIAPVAPLLVALLCAPACTSEGADPSATHAASVSSDGTFPASSRMADEFGIRRYQVSIDDQRRTVITGYDESGGVRATFLVMVTGNRAGAEVELSLEIGVSEAVTLRYGLHGDELIVIADDFDGDLEAMRFLTLLRDDLHATGAVTTAQPGSGLRTQSGPPLIHRAGKLLCEGGDSEANGCVGNAISTGGDCADTALNPGLGSAAGCVGGTVDMAEQGCGPCDDSKKKCKDEGCGPGLNSTCGYIGPDNQPGTADDAPPCGSVRKDYSTCATCCDETGQPC